MAITLPFGKWKDTPLADVPADYLAWALRECKLSSGLAAALRAELSARGLDAPAAPAPKPVPPCGRCGATTLTHHWQEDRLGRKRIRRACGSCGNWMGCSPMTEPFTTEADANANSTALLDVLTMAEEQGVTLTSDGHTVEFVGDGWHRADDALKQALHQCRHSLARMMGDSKKQVASF
jgi:uncharacterized protein (DUF3820 family)